MELLAGETLAARLARGPLPLAQALEYAIAARQRRLRVASRRASGRAQSLVSVHSGTDSSTGRLPPETAPVSRQAGVRQAAAVPRGHR
jgi:hypothetical protein